MSTKTEITALISSNLASASNITAVEHREVLNTGLVNEIYASKVTDTHLTTNVFTIGLGSIEYNLSITKRGNDVVVNGWIKNTSDDILGFFNLMSVTNSNYFPDGEQYTIAQNNILLTLTNANGLFLNGVMGSGQTVYFNFNYKAID